MTFDMPTEDPPSELEILEIAGVQVAYKIREFGRALTRLRDSEGQVVEADRLARDLNKGLNALFEERKRIAERRDKVEGSGPGIVLDLAAARSEVECRLARLAGAGPAG